MQEWVDTLRLKLREMKILSPKENFYSKLPEHRPPLLPTRDPMSPLPATPPVPAALVPGVERVIVPTLTTVSNRQVVTSSTNTVNTTTPSPAVSSSSSTPSSPLPSTISTATNSTPNVSTENNSSSSVSTASTTPSSSTVTKSTAVAIPSTSMSNTLSQNLINMLSNPVSTYSSQMNSGTVLSNADDEQGTEAVVAKEIGKEKKVVADVEKSKKTYNGPSLAKKFTENVLSDPNTSPSTSGLSSYASPVKRDLNDIKKADNDLGKF